jgi:hypothetical protein
VLSLRADGGEGCVFDVVLGGDVVVCCHQVVARRKEFARRGQNRSVVESFGCLSPRPIVDRGGLNAKNAHRRRVWVGISPLGGRWVMTLEGTAVPTLRVGCS